MPTNYTRNALAQAKLTVEAEARRVLLRTALVKHPEVQEALRLLPASIKPSLHIHQHTYSNEISLYVTLRELKSFKDKRLLNLLAKFDGDWEAKTNDYTYSGTPNRDFNFSQRRAWLHPTGDRNVTWLRKHGLDVPYSFTLEVLISAYVKSDSPLCRVEVVGFEEKVVKTEIKKIVCA